MLRAILLVFLLLPAVAEAQAIRVHKNGVSQTAFDENRYTIVSFDACAYMVCPGFYNNGWMPVAPGFQPKAVTIGGQVWVSQFATGTTGSGNPANYVVKVIKWKGSEYIEAIATSICMKGTFRDSMVCPLTTGDIAKPGEVYKIHLFATNGAAVVDGDPAHTYFFGAVTGDPQ